jgi:hypothetical protein
MPNATVPAAVGGLPALDALDKIDAARDLIEAIFMASGDIGDEAMSGPIRAVCNVASTMLREASATLAANIRRRA